MISNQCAHGRHAGGYAPQPPGSRVVGDAFQPPCTGTMPVPARTGNIVHSERRPCDCTCHAPGANPPVPQQPAPPPPGPPGSPSFRPSAYLARESVQCSGITAKGKRCSRVVFPPFGKTAWWCRAHRSQP